MSQLPKISIVTPSFNQASFIGETLNSIHSQKYPNLEHIVMDGGSTDGSVEIIQKYADKLSWTSKPDEGQYQAIAEGFEQSSGEVLGWLNSDDMYLPGTLHVVGEIFRDLPDVEWITTRFPVAINEKGAITNLRCFPGYSRYHFLNGEYLEGCGWPAMGFIQQESTFWRRSLWEKAGAMFRKDLNLAGDFELWSRFFKQSKLCGVDVPLGCFRRHGDQKTSLAGSKYIDEAKNVFEDAGGKVPPALAQIIRLRLLDACGTSKGWRRRATKLGLLKGASNITFDGECSRWIMDI